MYNFNLQYSTIISMIINWTNHSKLKLDIATLLVVTTLVVERDRGVHLLRIHDHRALDPPVELGLHQLPQNISSRTNHEREFELHRLNRWTVHASQARSTSVQRNVASSQSYCNRPMAFSWLVKFPHLHKLINMYIYIVISNYLVYMKITT